MEFKLVLGVLKAGLDLWASKEASKYRDRVIELEAEYYMELRKPFNERSQLFLDDHLLELRSIAENFIQYATKK